MANDPMQFDTEEDAVQIARYLAAKTPAYLAWSREAEPDIGADGPPMILFSTWRSAGHGVILTPARFNECLNLLRWSQLDLAAALECDVFLVNAWSNGIAAVPDDIAAWLDKLGKAHAKAGIPDNYKGVQFKMKIGK